MTTNMGTQALRARLAEDLAPVRSPRATRGALAVGVAVVAIALAVAFGMGVRDDLMRGSPHMMFVLRTGILALLGLAATVAVLAAARPYVGKPQVGWGWAAAAAAMFPATALVMALLNPPTAIDMRMMPFALECLGTALASAVVIGGVLTAWLRRGAPTNPERAGLLIGLASGSLGLLAYNLHCPFNNIYYLGIVYPGAVLVTALAGRLLVPPLLRW